MEMISLEHLEHCFEQKKIIDDVNFKVNKGKVACIVGLSGAGKSTILNLISGIITPTKGNVKVNGECGYMFQDALLFNWLTIYQNIILGLKIKKEKPDEMLIDKLLDTYHLSHLKNEFPRILSGGMAQRVALIRTLVTKPDILLLDEPFSALDAQTRIEVSEDVLKMIKLQNLTTILVTHDILEAVTFGDDVYVLSSNPGSIVKHYHIDHHHDTIFERRLDKEENEVFKMIWRDLIELKK